MELTMNVTTNGYGGLDELGIGLIGEDLFGFLDDEFYLFLSDWFEWSEVFDDSVEFQVVLAHLLLIFELIFNLFSGLYNYFIRFTYYLTIYKLVIGIWNRGQKIKMGNICTNNFEK